MSFLTHGKIAQQVGLSAAGVSATGTTLNGGWISAADAPQIAVAISANQNASVQWQEATDDQGTGAQNLGDSVDLGANFGTSEINSAAVTTGFTHVRAVVTLAATGAAGAIYLLGNQRYS